jgi:uncharacterized membrane protein YfhO
MKRYSNVLEVVDCKKWKIWCFRGFLGSVNDSKMLCKFSLCGYAQFQILFDVSKGANALLQIMVYFINKINQKGSHYDICQFDQSLVLDKSIWHVPVDWWSNQHAIFLLMIFFINGLSKVIKKIYCWLFYCSYQLPNLANYHFDYINQLHPLTFWLNSLWQSKWTKSLI